MTIDIQEGQYCVVGSVYTNRFRVIRADKVSPKQIRSRRWANSYDVTVRTLVTFAGNEADAKRLCDKANEIGELCAANKRDAEEVFREKAAPLTRERNAKIARAREECDAELAALFSEQVAS